MSGAGQETMPGRKEQTMSGERKNSASGRKEQTVSGRKQTKSLLVLYAVLLFLYLLTSVYIIVAARSDASVTVFGIEMAVSMFVGVLSSFSNMCIIIMVVYCRKIGFITSIVLLLSQLPLNFMGMIQQHNVSTIPGIFNNLLVIAAIILIYRKNKRIGKLQDLELNAARERQNVAERLFQQTAKSLVNAIDAKDEYSKGHSLRVAEYSEKIARALGKNNEECKEIYYAGLLHDVGKIGVPNRLLNKDGKITDEEYDTIKEHAIYGKQILSGISAYPFLSIGANYHHEKYDGTGYPEGLKGDEIPEIARIISVADAYDAMASNRSYRDAMPQFIVREEIFKYSGTQFDPEITKVMLHLIDLDSEYQMKERAEVSEKDEQTEIHCGEYREQISEGVLITETKTEIRFKALSEGGETIPTMILFDASDGRVHKNEKEIRDYGYFEYAEIRLDGKAHVTGARTIKTDGSYAAQAGKAAETSYKIEAARFKDHMRLAIDDGREKIHVTVALPNCSQFSYIALTGEHCVIRDFSADKTDETIGENDIERIAPVISYIDGPAGDIPNVQIDGYRADATKSVPVSDGLEIRFHTMSLPSANLIWHCPFVVLKTTTANLENGRENTELALVRFNGEIWKLEKGDITSELSVEKTPDFEGWEAWKENNKKGYDSRVTFERKGNRITMTTENLGIAIKTTTCIGADEKVYAFLTGDQVALTDIRIVKGK